MGIFAHGCVLGLLFIFSWGRALADEFDDALAAYRRGHFSTALAICKPMAEAGNREVQSALGRMYLADDFPRDTVKAYMWLSLAAIKGDLEAASESRELVALMSRDEIHEATGLIEAQRQAEIPRIAEREQAESHRAEMQKRNEAELVANRQRSSWAGQRCLGYGYMIDDPRFPECIERETQVQALIKAQEAQGRAIAEATEEAAETAAQEARRQNALRSLREMNKSNKSVHCEALSPTAITCSEY